MRLAPYMLCYVTSLLLAGESEAKLRQLFQEATQLAPCIVFIGTSASHLLLHPHSHQSGYQHSLSSPYKAIGVYDAVLQPQTPAALSHLQTKQGHFDVSVGCPRIHTLSALCLQTCTRYAVSIDDWDNTFCLWPSL